MMLVVNFELVMVVLDGDEVDIVAIEGVEDEWYPEGPMGALVRLEAVTEHACRLVNIVETVFVW